MTTDRPPYFAHRFVRLLAKAAVATELGPEVCWLLTVVVFTEDARRYAGPVTFWNDQLAPIVGCSSTGRLLRVRDKAVQAGWLNYTPGAKGRAAQYRVTIPPEFAQLVDGASDEPLSGCTLKMEENPEILSGCTLKMEENPTAEPRIHSQNGSASDKNPETFIPIPNTKREKARAQFVPPTLEEVRKYAQTNNLLVDPDSFVDHYSSNGWKVGKHSMKDWQAAVRQWSRRQAAFSVDRPPQAPAPSQRSLLTPPTR